MISILLYKWNCIVYKLVVICIDIFSLCIHPLKFIQIACIKSSFFHCWEVFYSMDIWQFDPSSFEGYLDVFSLGYYKLGCYKHLCTGFCMNLSFHFLLTYGRDIDTEIPLYKKNDYTHTTKIGKWHSTSVCWNNR